MALPTVNDKNGKKGNKNNKNVAQNPKFGAAKPGKAGSFMKKPPKPGGTRGS